MSKFPTRDGFTTPGSGEDDAGISAPEYPPHERFWFDDGSVTFVVRPLSLDPGFLYTATVSDHHRFG